MINRFASQLTKQAHFWDQNLVFISPTVRVEVHRHRCYQIVIALTSTFDCTIAGKELCGLRGFIVNQNIPHACRVNAGKVLVSFMEADSYWGWQLQSWLAGQPYLNLADRLEPSAFDSLLPDGDERATNQELITHINSFFERIFPFDESLVDSQRATNSALEQVNGKTDERIIKAKKYIHQHLHHHLVLGDVASYLNLSPERARHLFTTETGIPFSQYVIWKRIKAVLNETINEECTLAEACIRFGFVDQPHFNRQFKQIFGTPPTALIKGGRVVM